MSGAISVLPYHLAVADILEQENPNAFRALAVNRTEDRAVLDQALLRSTYRLDAEAHLDVHDAAGRAAAALQLDVPIELYADSAGSGTNAELIFVPSRAVILFSGETLNILDNDELCALTGHELAHHVLWTADGGRYLAASRLLDAAESDARTPSEYLETARRLRLATELFADRGALRACGQLDVAVSSLVKMTTGLRTVAPDAYLRQASEIDFSKPSEGSTHPETVLRAWALQEWDQNPEQVEDAVATVLAPQLDLSSVDIVAQDELARLTRGLVAAILTMDGLSGADEVELAEHYGVSVSVDHARPPDLTKKALSKESRRYLAAVLVDFATANPDAGAESQAQALAVARQIGLGSETEKLLVQELGLSDRARATLTARATELSVERVSLAKQTGADV